MAGNEADDILSSILGSADPGDDGRADEGNDDTLDTSDDTTGDVADDDIGDQHEAEDLGSDTDGDGDGEGEDGSLEGLEALADRKQEKPQRGRPPKDKQPPANKGKELSPFDPSQRVTTDKKGNVYLGDKLIARAGQEARIYMGFRKEALKDRQAAEQLAQQVGRIAEGAKELYARYEALNNTKTMFENAGLTPEEQNQLLQVATAYKKNPIEGIKMLLTRAHMAGVDIKQLGAGGGLDPKVLMSDMKALIAEEMRPLREQTVKNANQDKLANEARGFFQRNKRATEVAKLVGGTHRLGTILKEAKMRSPDLTLDELFQRLDYAILSSGVQIPADTGPVEPRRPARRPNNAQARRMEKNFGKSVTRNKNNPSFDDIGRDLLRDIARVNESRGF